MRLIKIPKKVVIEYDFNFAILLNMSSYNLFLLLNNSSVYKKVAEFLICSSAIFWKDY